MKLSVFAILLFVSVSLLGSLHTQAQAQAPAVEPELKDLNGFFPFHVPDDLDAWEKRAALLRQRVLVANGLHPLPPRTPLNAVVHGKIERPGFSVEKVYFESVPGFHVTGLLFRPAGKSAKPGHKYPAVLSPHGHGGRLMDLGEDGVLKQIESGGEKFADSGRFPKVARCATLARLGCVVLLYDMIGYADNQQLSRDLGHGFKVQRPDFEGKDSWGLYSAQAEMRLQSIFGLQTWNSVRALDFLEGLADVDPQRIAVTGGSGGGTQTIMICAIDPRPIVAFPNGMVSSSMQGGCTCENASLLRIGTGNVELAALYAPKPQGMTSANDWTKEMLVAGKGFPELQKLYGLYGKSGDVICEDLRHFPHNYNYVTREIMYRWFNKHLGLGHEEPIVEEDFKRLAAEEHAVYDEADHPRPGGGDAFERKLTRWLADESDKQLAALAPKERSEVVSAAWQTMVGIDDPISAGGNADWIQSGARGGSVTITLGKLAAMKETPTVANKREFAGYTHGYNHSVFARRARQVVAQIQAAAGAGKKVEIVAQSGTEAIALAACAASESGAVKSVQLAADDFRFSNITSYRDANFVPGAVKYGDLPGLIETARARGTEVRVN